MENYSILEALKKRTDIAKTQLRGEFTIKIQAFQPIFNFKVSD